MKWIKASERQPEDWSKVLVREIGSVHSFAPMYKLSHKNDLLILDAIREPIKDFPLKFVEWLDESEDCFDDVPEFVKHWDQEELKKAAKAKVDEIEDVDYEELIQLFIDGTEWAFVKSNK